MTGQYLPQGTILDERYEIRSLIGEGGFGMTYEAVNQITGSRMAVKEFCWRNHVTREETLRVTDSDEEETYEILKGKFLQEARLLRDFENEPAVVRVTDSFEDKGTAYMVMEYLDGVTLGRQVREKGPLQAEELFRKLLPVMEGLLHIHNAGVIHRDLSPDNLMLLSDGRIKLMDFGAARQYKGNEDSHFTTIVRDSYAPPEQYDKKGEQGPWTDVYALSATIYFCLTGKAPDGAVQRMFFDELKSPSDQGIKLDKAYESIIMKGLSMNRQKRQQSMEELLIETLKALPALPSDLPLWKKILRIALPAAAGAAFIIGLLAYHQYDITHKFRHVKTEEFTLYAPEGMTEEEMSASVGRVDSALTEFAGKDNYEMTAEEDTISVLLPLSVFDETEEIASVIEEKFLSLAGGEDSGLYFSYEYELQGTWEDPQGTLSAGDNQVSCSDLSGFVTTLLYEDEDSDDSTEMTKGQWSNMVTDIKIRLDSLGIPYAVGTLYGNDRALLVAFDRADKMGQPINEHLAEDGYFLIGTRDELLSYGSWSVAGNPEVIEGSDGTCQLKATVQLQNEETEAGGTVYLKNGDEYYASGSLGESYEQDGSLYADVLFDHFYLKDNSVVTEDSRQLIDFICSYTEETDPPESYELTCRNFRDADRNILWNVSGSDYYGLSFAEDISEQIYPELVSLMDSLNQDGYDAAFSYDGAGTVGRLFVYQHDELTKENIGEAIRKVSNLADAYQLDELPGNIVFSLMDETGNFRARIVALDNDRTEAGERKYELLLFNYTDGSGRETKALSDELITAGEKAFAEAFGDKGSVFS